MQAVGDVVHAIDERRDRQDTRVGGLVHSARTGEASAVEVDVIDLRFVQVRIENVWEPI